MAYARIYDRWSTEWTILADSDEEAATVEAAFPDAPLGSKILIAGESAVPTEYMLFPSGWAQTSNFSG